VKSEAIAILTGNLAPGGAAIKLASATPELFQHEGPALVFDSLEDLEKRIDDPNLNVTPQTVMVLRNAGPIGAPGCRRPARCRSRRSSAPRASKTWCGSPTRG
jgi:dihydroxy-acid dehydratase